MPIEDLLDECLRIRATGGDVTPLLAQYPELRGEVEALLDLVQTAERLPRAELAPETRERMFKRLRAATERPPGAENNGRVEASSTDEAPVHQLAHRLGVPLEAIRRYLGPHGAAQFSQFLGLPGYSGMFAALGWLLRCLQVLERHGLWL
jgi:hypothetical protein